MVRIIVLLMDTAKLLVSMVSMALTDYSHVTICIMNIYLYKALGF